MYLGLGFQGSEAQDGSAASLYVKYFYACIPATSVPPNQLFQPMQCNAMQWKSPELNEPFYDNVGLTIYGSNQDDTNSCGYDDY